LGFIIRDDQVTALAAGVGKLERVADALHAEADSTQLKKAITSDNYDLTNSITYCIGRSVG
jgi:hypothetical protein